jgi:hypothetical protein
LSGAVPGAGFLGGDGSVRHEVGGRADDAGAVAAQDDRAVHLGQLAQLRGRELDIQREAAGANRFDGFVPPADDQRAGVAAENPLQSVAQFGSGASDARTERSASSRSAAATENLVAVLGAASGVRECRAPGQV